MRCVKYPVHTARLNKAHVSITDIPEVGSFVFFDNYHLCLEVIWPRDEGASG
jgi:hypothetical protein